MPKKHRKDFITPIDTRMSQSEDNGMPVNSDNDSLKFLELFNSIELEVDRKIVMEIVKIFAGTREKKK